MRPGAGDLECGGYKWGDELLGSRVQGLYVGTRGVDSEVVPLRGVFVRTTSRLGTLA